MNLVEGLQAECNRCRAIMANANEIGPEGAFLVEMIKAEIAVAEKAIAGGDPLAMLESLQSLKEYKE